MKSRKMFEEVNIIVDSQTGEQIEHSRRFTKQVEKEKFMMVYLENMAGILEVNSPIEFKVLLSLWQLSEFDTNKIFIVKDTKEEIALKTGYQFKTVENAISKLSKKDLLIRKSTAVYFLNPKYFFKGSEIARANAAKVIFEFKFVDKTENAFQDN